MEQVGVAEFLDSLTFDDRGLLPAVVQGHDGLVLMVAYMNRESLERTIESGRTWFFSRSRQELWPKGETSGDVQLVKSIRFDCDGDSLLVTVEQLGGGACHTGAASCFYRELATKESSAQTNG